MTELVTTPTKRVAAYCRVSTDMEQQKTSLAAQTEAFQQTIHDHPGWTLVAIYADEGVSGTSAMKRKAFQRMMADCEAGKIDYILTKSISRFARNTLDTLSYVRKLKEMGIYVYFERERLDTGNPASELIMTVLAAVAQEESRSTSENIKWGYRKRFQDGLGKWSPIYGYTRDGEREYLIVEEEAQVVRRIFQLYAEGKSLPKIAARLTEDQVPSPRGKSWAVTTLSHLLHNEKYVGDVVLQKHYTPDYLLKKKILNDGSLVPRYYKKGHHAPIVDRHTYEMVQKILSMKDRHKGSTQYPYYGLLHCPLCGGLMYRYRMKGHEGGMAWTCGRSACPPYAVREKYIDQALREGLKQVAKAELQAIASDRRDEARQNAARAALQYRGRSLKKIEYILLDQLVESFAFLEWDRVQIVWKFGVTSQVDICYQKHSHHPFAQVAGEAGHTIINGIDCGFVPETMLDCMERTKKRAASMQVIPVREVEGCFTRPRVYMEDSRARLPEGEHP